MLDRNYKTKKWEQSFIEAVTNLRRSGRDSPRLVPGSNNSSGSPVSQPFTLVLHLFYYMSLSLPIKISVSLIRSRASHLRCWTSLQGHELVVKWPAHAPRYEKVPDHYAVPLRATQPSEGHGSQRWCRLMPILRLILLCVLWRFNLPYER